MITIIVTIALVSALAISIAVLVESIERMEDKYNVDND